MGRVDMRVLTMDLTNSCLRRRREYRPMTTKDGSGMKPQMDGWVYVSISNLIAGMMMKIVRIDVNNTYIPN